MSSKSAIFTYVGRSTFVGKDIEIIKKIIPVSEFNFSVAHKWQTPFMFLKQFLFLCKGIFTSKLYVCQFSGYHSFLPALFAKISFKPCLIIAGGTDCHSFPIIGYGNFQKTILRTFTKWSYKLCSVISPKHQTLWFTEYSYDSLEPERQGIKAFIPSLDKPYQVIPNGYDPDQYKKVADKIPKTVLTVGGNLHYPFQTYLKGIDLFMKLAEFHPEYKFTIIGMAPPCFKSRLPRNVNLLPFQNMESMIELYSRHTFYLQLSMAEGFPNSLCEAMLCECVPIGSDIFSIPEIIKDTGFILPNRNIELLNDIFKKAIQCNSENLGQQARKRIVENYSLKRRETDLHTLLKQLLGEKVGKVNYN